MTRPEGMDHPNRLAAVELATLDAWIAALRDPCATHPLRGATSPTPSTNGRVVYVVCACGARRAVAPAVWEAEVQRREEAAAAHESPGIRAALEPEDAP